MSTFEKELSEPWFSLTKYKIKKVEGRLNKGDFSKMQIGDSIFFTNNDLGFERSFLIKIKKISNYETFEEYLKNEGLEKTLPTVESIEDGIKVYYKYYTKNDELKYKIKAFTF